MKKEEKETIYVYCNASCLELIHPLEVSKPILTSWNLSFVALYNLEDLQKIAEDIYEQHNAFWREVGSLNISIDEDYQPRVMRKTGLLNWLCDVHGISVERNIAGAIGNLSRMEGRTPIEFINSL